MQNCLKHQHANLDATFKYSTWIIHGINEHAKHVQNAINKTPLLNIFQRPTYMISMQNGKLCWQFQTSQNKHGMAETCSWQHVCKLGALIKVHFHIFYLSPIFEKPKWYQIYLSPIFYCRESFYPIFHIFYFWRKIIWIKSNNSNLKMSFRIFQKNFQLIFLIIWRSHFIFSQGKSLSCMKFLNLEYFQMKFNSFQKPFSFI